MPDCSGAHLIVTSCLYILTEFVPSEDLSEVGIVGKYAGVKCLLLLLFSHFFENTKYPWKLWQHGLTMQWMSAQALNKQSKMERSVRYVQIPVNTNSCQAEQMLVFQLNE